MWSIQTSAPLTLTFPLCLLHLHQTGAHLEYAYSPIDFLGGSTQSIAPFRPSHEGTWAQAHVAGDKAALQSAAVVQPAVMKPAVMQPALVQSAVVQFLLSCVRAKAQHHLLLHRSSQGCMHRGHICHTRMTNHYWSTAVGALLLGCFYFA